METLAPLAQRNPKGVWKQRWDAFWHPLDPEKQSYLQHRWQELPEELKTPNQMAGRHLTHCAFTLGTSFCSFHCTHCYLPKEANRIPIPSLDEMREQIAANRRFQGPGAGIQITGRDVVDAYFRADRFQELIEIVQMSYAAGLIPMLFTHGQTLIENPHLLERLVVEGGLCQVAVHIDMTQAGPHGYPINTIRSEADLHAVREAFLKLALETRKKTGRRVEFAHNCTVTRKNLDGVREILRWMLADPIRCDVALTPWANKKTHTKRFLHFGSPAFASTFAPAERTPLSPVAGPAHACHARSPSGRDGHRLPRLHRRLSLHQPAWVNLS